MLRFTSWFDLREEEVKANAPAGPAALQVRQARGLLEYPTGKSAMVWYGYAEESARGLLAEEFAEELREPGVGEHGPQQFRFMEGGEQSREALEIVWKRFEKRFGSPPVRNH